MPTTLHVVSHTHWDREWYLPFEAFRLRLLSLLDHLLEILEQDASFKHFSLDAQTIVLEDYLAIRPHARNELVKHIELGRIGVGPWYQLNDEFLVSGEATVRSLLIGHRLASEFGKCMKIGYLPDQFGNISQMPQILQGFGIDNAIMGRGRQLVGDGKMEFWWEAPNGSRVLASLMAYWYNNAQYVPQDSEAAVGFFAEIRDRMKAQSATSHLLLMNGVDHLEAEPWVGRVIEQATPVLRERSGDVLMHSSLTNYVNALRDEVVANNLALETVRGELREDRGGSCLAGTLSSRVYLKQANDAAQNDLERYAEPLAAFAMLTRGTYPKDELRYAWQLLMQNHPHDSICGCSVDEVHDEMMSRFRRVRQVAAVCCERALDSLTGRHRTQGAVALPCDLYVINTLNWPRTDPVHAIIEVPLGAPSRGNPQRSEAAVLRGLRMVGPSGEDVHYEVIANETLVTTVSNPLELPLDQWVQRITLQFVATDVEAGGYAVYRLEPADGWGGPHASIMEPAALGACDRLTLEDVGDVGDEYLFRSPLNDVRMQFRPETGAHWAEEASAVRRTSLLRKVLQLPAHTEPSGRSAEMANCPVTVRVTSWKGVPRREVRIEVDNSATNHRLRALFETGRGSCVVAGGQFDVIERAPLVQETSEGASPFFPMTLWVDAETDAGSPNLTVIAPGLHEYEPYRAFDGTVGQIGITLLRCVGQLSARGDGPGISTPGAQCPGKHVFDLAVCEHAGDWQTDEVWRQAHQFACPLVTAQAPIRAEVPRCRSFLSVTPASLVVTALKRAEDRDTLIVRFYNTTESAVEEGCVTIMGASAWRRVNLNEEALEDWTGGSQATMQVHPKEIVTMEFQL